MANGVIDKPAPTTADLAGAINPDDDLQPLLVDADGNLMVNVATGTIIADNPSVGPTGVAVPAEATFVAGTDGTSLRGLSVNSSGVLALPQGAATETTLSALNTKVPSGLTVTSTRLLVDGSGAVQPVSGTVTANQGGTWNLNNVSGTVSLPTGAATSAKQPALGTAGSASADVITVQGITSMTPLLVNGSGSTQPVSGTVTANQGGTWNINNVSGTVSLPTGAATEATLSTLNGKVTACNTGAVVIASGTTVVTQPTGSNLHVAVDSMPTTTVTGTVAATQSGTWTVQPGNTANTTAWLVKESVASSSAVTSVASSATSVSLLAVNANRLGATFFNDSTQILYLKLGATASNSSYTVQIGPNGYYELPVAHIYTGAIDGIWASANGNARITELS